MTSVPRSMSSSQHGTSPKATLLRSAGTEFLNGHVQYDTTTAWAPCLVGYQLDWLWRIQELLHGPDTSRNFSSQVNRDVDPQSRGISSIDVQAAVADLRP